MKKLFKISKSTYDFKIQEIEYTRKTDSFYWTVNTRNGKEERTAIETTYNICMETKKDAIAYMKNQLESSVKVCKDSLSNAEAKLQMFNIEFNPCS